MHWTLQANLWLCALCLALNAWQWSRAGSVRPVGMLICAAWAAQEGVWASYGGSLPLVIAGGLCDALIAVYALRHCALPTTDRIVVALLPASFAAAVFAHVDGHSASWWLSWSIVAAQMVLGLPRPKLQRIWGQVSHGRLRPETGETRRV